MRVYPKILVDGLDLAIIRLYPLLRDFSLSASSPLGIYDVIWLQSHFSKIIKLETHHIGMRIFIWLIYRYYPDNKLISG